jgi:hypothetical protein
VEASRARKLVAAETALPEPLEHMKLMMSHCYSKWVKSGETTHEEVSRTLEAAAAQAPAIEVDLKEGATPGQVAGEGVEEVVGKII